MNVSTEDQKIVSILSHLSGVFILKEIYQKIANHQLKEMKDNYFSNYLTSKHLEYLGFKRIDDVEKIVSKDNDSEIWKKDGHPFSILLTEYSTNVVSLNKIDTLYTIGDFIEYWEKEAGEKLDLNELSKRDVYDECYEEFQNKLIDYNKKVDIYHQYLEEKKLNPELALNNHDKWKHLFENKYLMFSNDDYFIEYYNPFKSYQDDVFLNIFNNWILFKRLYKEILINGELKDDFKMFRAFYQMLNYCNKLFFPTVSNQTKGYEPFKALLDISLEFIKSKKED